MIDAALPDVQQPYVMMRSPDGDRIGDEGELIDFTDGNKVRVYVLEAVVVEVEELPPLPATQAVPSQPSEQPAAQPFEFPAIFQSHLKRRLQSMVTALENELAQCNAHAELELKQVAQNKAVLDFVCDPAHELTDKADRDHLFELSREIVREFGVKAAAGAAADAVPPPSLEMVASFPVAERALVVASLDVVPFSNKRKYEELLLNETKAAKAANDAKKSKISSKLSVLGVALGFANKLPDVSNFSCKFGELLARAEETYNS